jgi:hypothetical protein
MAAARQRHLLPRACGAVGSEGAGESGSLLPPAPEPGLRVAALMTTGNRR